MTTNSPLHSILVAHVLSEFLVSQTAKSDSVEVPLSTFMSKLNGVVIAYNKIFHYPAHYAINVESLKSVIESTSLSKVVSPASLDDGVLQIQASQFQEVVTEVVVESTIKHGNELIKELNHLKDRYNSDEPDPEPEPAPEVSEGAEPAADLNLSSVATEPPSTAPALSEPEEVPVSLPDIEESTMASAVTSETPAEIEADVAPMEIDQQAIEEAVEQAEEEERQKAFVLDALVGPEEIDQSKEAELEEQLEDPQVREQELEEQEAQEQRAQEQELKEEIEDEVAAEETPAATGPEAAEVETKPGPEAAPDSEPQDLSDEEPLQRRTRSATPTVEPESAKKPKEAPTQKAMLQEQLETPRKRSASPSSATQKQKRFQTIAVNLIKSIEEHRFSSPFLTAVTADDYKDVIYHPKDLKSILKAVKQKENPPYQSVKELERDVMLMFANCVMFNKSSTPLVEMAREMKEEVRNTFQMFEDAEAGVN